MTVDNVICLSTTASTIVRPHDVNQGVKPIHVIFADDSATSCQTDITDTQDIKRPNQSR